MWSNGLVRDFRAGRFLPVLSDVTAAEVRSAPETVRELHQELLLLAGTVLAVTMQALSLAAAYQARGILGRRFRGDMLHIALATLAEVVLLAGVLPAAALLHAQEWTKDAGIRIPDGSAPYVYRLKDGSLRLLSCGRGGILSARSTDGLNFAPEPGVRLAPVGGPGPPEFVGV